MVKHATPGSEQLSLNLAKYLGRYDAYLLQSHGLVTTGKTIEEAFNRIEKVERYAEILHKSEQLGGINLLSRTETEQLLKLSGRDFSGFQMILLCLVPVSGLPLR